MSSYNITDTGTSGFLGSSNIGAFGYGIGVSVGILLLITTITLASYFCTRGHHPPPPSGRRDPLEPRSVVVELGLDENTIKGYPTMKYSEVKGQKKTSDSCCSVCLADYRDADKLRMLPECGHLFHQKCIDPWIRMHPTCPVCRTSPVPTPVSTPLAEVVPLATRRG